MQKNKFIHEDIKAVCSSATKKLIACGLVVAVNGGNIVNAQTREFDAQKQLKKELQVEETTAVRSVSNTANSQSRSDVLPRASGGSATTVTENASNLVLNEQVQEQPNTSAPAVASEQTTAVNAPNEADVYSQKQFEKEAKELLALIRARDEEIEEVFEKAKENFEKQQKQVKELQIKIDEHEIKIPKKTARILAYYEHNPDKGKWKFTGDNYLDIDDVSLQRFGSHSEKIETAANAYALRRRLDYLRERIHEYNGRLESGLFPRRRYSQRYNQVEEELQPQRQNPEPPRYDIEQAPAYVEWATPEVARLEQLARDMQQQLHLDEREQTDFENILCWFNPQWELRMLLAMAATDSLDEFLDESRHVTEALQRLQHITEESIAFFSQPYESPFNNNQVQNDNNMINNNQFQEIEEIREVEEDHNQFHNNQQQRQTINIAPLNPPVRQIIHETLNQTTPQQGNGFVRGTINFIGNTISNTISNTVSLFIPFKKK